MCARSARAMGCPVVRSKLAWAPTVVEGMPCVEKRGVFVEVSG
jgi:hypothetical protein